MELADFSLLLAYERWATRRILDAAERVEETVWSAPNEIGDRGLGGILVHQYGALARWRVGLSRPGEQRLRPEADPLPTLAELRARIEAEWNAWDSWLGGLRPEQLALEEQGITLGQALLHVFNHGTQHRSESAVLLTRAGSSPGDLDLVDFVVERRGGASGA